MENVEICCCTGHRPKGFPWAYQANIIKTETYLRLLEEKVRRAAEDGATLFLTGMAQGVDMDFAECVIKLRDRCHLPVALKAVIPCRNQTEFWSKEEVQRYVSILCRADDSVVLSDEYTPQCMLLRNRFMVDNSDLVIAVFNGIRRGGTWYTMRYAKKQGVRIDLLDLAKDI